MLILAALKQELSPRNTERTSFKVLKKDDSYAFCRFYAGMIFNAVDVGYSASRGYDWGSGLGLRVLG